MKQVIVKDVSDKKVDSTSKTEKKPIKNKTGTDLVLQLQHSVGNQTVQRLIKSGVLHSKLKVSQPADIYEQKADRIAEQIVNMSGPIAPNTAVNQVNKFDICEEEMKIHRKAGNDLQASDDVANNIENIRGRGVPLDGSTKEFMESKFGSDFSKVRIHTDDQAARTAEVLNAQAYTFGNDIVFGTGKYSPLTTSGKYLIAHELAHTMQQSTLASKIYRKIDKVSKSGNFITLEMGIGIYGSRANSGLASKWEKWINGLWNGNALCKTDLVWCVAPTRVNATVTAHPLVNWWWNVPESNSAFVREPDYRSMTNTLIDSGDWAENDDDRTIAHETGHLMGQPDYYWNIPFMDQRSKGGYENDIMANYYKDRGPTEYDKALSRIIDDNNIECPCINSARDRGIIKPKLKISQPNDIYEQEADHIAEQVMHMPDQKINHEYNVCEEEEKKIHRNAGNDFEVSDEITNDINIIRDGGVPLDGLTRNFMESRFGFDFSRVRIHVDERATKSAESVNALAYAVGDHVVFGEGQYTPKSEAGQKLLAHELTHVIQQTKGGILQIQRDDKPYHKIIGQSSREREIALGERLEEEGFTIIANDDKGVREYLGMPEGERCADVIARKGNRFVIGEGKGRDPIKFVRSQGPNTLQYLQKKVPGARVSFRVEVKAEADLNKLGSGYKAPDGILLDDTGKPIRIEGEVVHVHGGSKIKVSTLPSNPKTSDVEPSIVPEKEITATTGVPSESENISGSSVPVPETKVLAETPPEVLGEPTPSSGGGSGIIGGILAPAILLGLGYLHQKATEKRIKEQVKSQGFAPYGPSGEGILYDIGSWLIDPSMGRGIGIEKRFDIKIWRARLRSITNSKMQGETLTVNWQVGGKIEPWGDQEIEYVEVTYRKGTDGKWQFESGDMKDPPDINIIIDPNVSDDTIERHLHMGYEMI